jgi:phenylalanyl-tRNA synthetase beta chain
MLVSLNWLKDYVNIDGVDANELAERITRAGIEVEGVEMLSEATNVVVGHVTSHEKHPNSDKLSLCQVNVGDETLQIVCGAPNVGLDQKVLVAKNGAVLPGDFKIKPTVIRDVESNGMICSLEELGLESKYIDDEFKDGIQVLSADAPVGVDGIEYLKYDDTILELGLTPNRADAMSMLGVAYEVAAILKEEIRLPQFDLVESDKLASDEITIKVETEKTPMYTARVVKGVTVKPSPQFIKARLTAAGIRPINNIVDIGNYVMLEYGQPLHAFDQDKLGNEILVRQATQDEKVTTLDDIERTLNPNHIVITDGKKPMVVAGVMGASDPEVDESTINIVIESAFFNNQSIRTAMKDLQLRSDSGARFEKGIDPNRTIPAVDRAAYLMQKYAGGEILKGVVTYDNLEKEEKVVSVTRNKVNTVLGMDISNEDIIDSFLRLGFKVDANNEEYVVTVPTRRMDIEIAEDLIEEVGRMYGYDNLHAKLPSSKVKQGRYSSSYATRKFIRKVLNGLGLHQTLTYSLVPENYLTKYTNDSVDPIALMSPMSEDKSTLRYSLIPSLLDVVVYNMKRKNDTVKVFEIGSSYYNTDEGPKESLKLSGALTGNLPLSQWQAVSQKVDFYYVKGIVETVLNQLGLNGRYSFKVPSNLPKEFHPTRTAEVYVGRDFVGYIGQVNPQESKTEVYVFELYLDKLLDQKVRLIKFKEINKYPSIKKDIAFVVKKEILSEDIAKLISKTGGRDLISVEVFDVYEGEHVAADEKSLAFNLVFENTSKTLTDDEVMTSFEKIIQQVEKKFDAKLRG